MQRLVGWKRILALAGIAIASAALTLGMVELVARFFLTPMLVRYSENQALKLQLANRKDLGIASLYVPHHYYLFSTRPAPLLRDPHDHRPGVRHRPVHLYALLAGLLYNR